ncbi:MAG TPA: FtsX-like permease family protein [Candidatus Limnocylindrales bacterium]
MMIGSRLRRRPGRAAALFAGILAATTGFIVLMGGVATSRLQVTQEVETNFRAAYDILVRPPGSRTAIEDERGLVRPNYLSGQLGGITPQQWEQIKQVPGVELAAPIANLGFVSTFGFEEVDLTSYVDKSLHRQVIRLSPTWIADRGLTKVPDAPIYVYVTKNPLYTPVRQEQTTVTYEDGTVLKQAGGCLGLLELLPDGGKAEVCGTMPAPFSPGAGEASRTWFHAFQLMPDGRFATKTALQATGLAPQDRLICQIGWWTVVGAAGVDPESEARLVGLDKTVVNGRYLEAKEPMGVRTHTYGSHPTIPVLASTKLYDEEGFALDITRLSGEVAAAPTRERSDGLRARLKAEAGAGLGRIERQLTRRPFDRPVFSWGDDRPEQNLLWSNVLSAGSTSYTTGPGGALVPVGTPAPPDSVWTGGLVVVHNANSPPAFVGDSAFREVGTLLRPDDIIESQFVGQFDPTRLTGFSEVSRAPLETYQAPVATGADDRSRQLLGDQPLQPNSNLGGYLSQPPLILTSLTAASELLQRTAFGNAPISAVRVRVAGLESFDELGRERIRVIAEQIALATGLDVDITAGASPSPQTVALPAGKYGRPELNLSEGWSRKGVAVAIIQAVDRKSAVLFTLILAVCLLFLGNALTAAVRSRCGELGVLACLGWSRPQLARLIVVEVGGIGLAAGVLSALVAWPVSGWIGVRVGMWQLLAAVPVALGLSIVAAIVPAWQASRSAPVQAITASGVSGRRRAWGRPRTILGLAVRNCLRLRVRSGVGVVAMALGVGALTVIATLQYGFHGEITGSLLGDAVSVKVRGVDTVAVIATVLLSAAAVGDVLYLNVRERSAELAALRACGWTDGAIARLVAYEGVLLGATGAVLGAGLGLYGVQRFSDAMGPDLVRATVITALIGVALAAVAAVVPAWLTRRLPMPHLLAQE